MWTPSTRVPWKANGPNPKHIKNVQRARLPPGSFFLLSLSHMNRRHTNLLLTCLLLIGSRSPLSAQEFFRPSDHYNPGRVNGTIIVESAIGTTVTIGLNYLWYKKFAHGKFHYFNDNNEWLNVDKVGHATTAYNIAAIQSDVLRWGGVRPGTAALIGTATALGFMTMIEIMDGHSDAWGFSKGDMLANLAGSLLFEGQQLMWGQQRISLKYSYHGTIFPHYHPAQ